MYSHVEKLRGEQLRREQPRREKEEDDEGKIERTGRCDVDAVMSTLYCACAFPCERMP